MYPLVFFDALRVKIHDDGLVRNKAVYVALGVTPDGNKDILGLWIETSEGAKFRLRVMNEAKNWRPSACARSGCATARPLSPLRLRRHMRHPPRHGVDLAHLARPCCATWRSMLCARMQLS
jgi:Transposase, Mutator family